MLWIWWSYVDWKDEDETRFGLGRFLHEAFFDVSNYKIAPLEIEDETPGSKFLEEIRAGLNSHNAVPRTVNKALSALRQYKLTQLKELIDEHYKIHPQKYMPMTHEYIGSMQVYKQRVERFLQRYFDGKAVEDFMKQGVAVLERLLADMHRVAQTDAGASSDTNHPQINIKPIYGITRRPSFVRITQKGLFQFADSFKVFRQKYVGHMAVIAEFENQIDPPRRIESAGPVRAQIFFQRVMPNEALFEVLRVTRGCWIGEETVRPEFGVEERRYLLIAAAPFREPMPNFLYAYEYAEQSDKPQILDMPLFTEFVVRVRLIPENHNELTVEFDYNLKISAETGFSFTFGPRLTENE